MFASLHSMMYVKDKLVRICLIYAHIMRLIVVTHLNFTQSFSSRNIRPQSNVLFRLHKNDYNNKSSQKEAWKSIIKIIHWKGPVPTDPFKF